MSVWLFDADNDVITPAVVVLGFPDGKFDRFALVAAMADYSSCVVDHVPSILGLVVVDMDGVVRTGFGGCLCHDQRPRRALPTFLRLLPTFLTALRTVDGFFLVFLASYATS